MAALLVPLILLLVLPMRLSYAWLAFWFAVLMIFNFAILWLMVRGRGAAPEMAAPPSPPPRILSEPEVPPVVQEVMDVRVALEDGGVQVFRGPLRASPEEAFEKLKSALEPAWIPLVQQDPEMEVAIFLTPRPAGEIAVEKPVRLWLHWALFGLTFLTTTYTGALYLGVNLLKHPEQFTVGLPYSIGLLAILGFHELGHYFTARHYKMSVTPPYFIPVPFGLGTFGAFIAMRSPPQDRRALFDVAVAGPLAGLVLAIPALILGLKTSTVMPAGPETQAMLTGGGAVGASILFALIAKAALGTHIAAGYVLHLSPLAFAGWLGLLVTALNLLPIGQLDGGHMAWGMFGSRYGLMISRASMWALFLLALFVWPSLLFWALIVFFIARRGSPPLNDLTPVGRGRLWLGMLSFLILALILIPMPAAFWAAIN